jgi:transposase-like protein
MPYRYYTDEQKQDALDVLEANGGNLAIASALTGIAVSTLSNWRRKYRPNLPLASARAVDTAPATFDLSEDDVQALMNLKHVLLQKAGLLAESIEPAISEAPLPQRIAGLTQLIDRIMKMSAQLPGDDADDIDYVIVGADTFERDDEDDEEEDDDEDEQTDAPGLAAARAARQSGRDPG